MVKIYYTFRRKRISLKFKTESEFFFIHVRGPLFGRTQPIVCFQLCGSLKLTSNDVPKPSLVRNIDLLEGLAFPTNAQYNISTFLFYFFNFFFLLLLLLYITALLLTFSKSKNQLNDTQIMKKA